MVFLAIDDGDGGLSKLERFGFDVVEGDETLLLAIY